MRRETPHNPRAEAQNSITHVHIVITCLKKSKVPASNGNPTNVPGKAQTSINNPPLNPDKPLPLRRDLRQLLNLLKVAASSVERSSSAAQKVVRNSSPLGMLV